MLWVIYFFCLFKSMNWQIIQESLNNFCCLTSQCEETGTEKNCFQKEVFTLSVNPGPELAIATLGKPNYKTRQVLPFFTQISAFNFYVT